MDLYEYQARDVFEKHGVPVLPGIVATTPAEAKAAAEELGGGTVVVSTSEISEAMMCDVSEGSMCRRMIRRSLAPSSRAAITKSSFFIARKRPRTTRPSSVQPTRDTISVMTKYCW